MRRLNSGPGATTTRIVVVAPHFAEYSLRLAHALAHHAPVLAIVDRRNLDDEMANDLRVTHPDLSIWAYSFRPRRSMYLQMWKLVARIALFRPTVIHFQEVPDTIDGVLMSMFRRFVPCVLTVHDPTPHSGREAAIPPLVRRWRDHARRHASAVVLHGSHCVTAFAALPESAGRRLVETTHGVILVPRARDRRLPVVGRILFFGRMEAYKGLETLAAAAAILASRQVPHLLHIAGRGPELDRLRCRLAVLPNVRLDDRYLTPGEAVAAFQEAAIVVLPYHDATQSGVVPAAFANERPVVASRVGGIPDIVSDGDNGLLVQPGDATALADAIAALLTRPLLREALSTGARRTAETMLAWPHIALQMVDLYRDLGRAQ